MHSFMTQVGQGGRVVIPSDFRKALGIKTGDRVVLSFDPSGALRIQTSRQAVLQAQAEVARYVTPERCLSQELIDERRLESDLE